MKTLLAVAWLLAVSMGAALGQVATEYRMAVVVHGHDLDVEASVEQDARAMRLSGMRKELVEANRANRREFLTKMQKGFAFEGTAAFYADDRLLWYSLPAPLVAKNIKVLQVRQWADEKAPSRWEPPGSMPWFVPRATPSWRRTSATACSSPDVCRRTPSARNRARGWRHGLAPTRSWR
ncbi:MAG: hypothetical protein KIS66_15675 [Fimbriimonadaceae bacterium]|nr:hypothetical protein [Fimbriimonadaceae bacterium]